MQGPAHGCRSAVLKDRLSAYLEIVAVARTLPARFLVGA